MGAVAFICVFMTLWLWREHGVLAAAAPWAGVLAAWLLLDGAVTTLGRVQRFAWHGADVVGINPNGVASRGLTGPMDVNAGWTPLPEHWVDLEDEILAAGWDAWAGVHVLRLLDVAPDPGHPHADLTLYEVVGGRWRGTRLVQVIDASPDEGGVHVRHGLCVPSQCRTALEAIASTWGLAPETYRPERHT